jgi:RNA 3'-terminal phosphate cyclase
MTTKKKTALEITKGALDIVSPMLGHLIGITIESVDEAKQVAENGDMVELRREAERQELMMQMAERQAKVAQELALARRIESAQEVEMEEFYDISGAGHAGVKSDASTVSAGFGAQGQKVTKRIFRFKGVTPSA